MVHRNDLGRVRVLCDRDGCEKKFVPRTPLVDYQETRFRASLYGWVSGEVSGSMLDFCPDDRRELDQLAPRQAVAS